MTAKKTRPGSTPEDILRDFPLDIRAIAEALRQVVKLLVPEVIEKAYPGWRAIGYRHPSAGYFCGIFPQEVEVHLLFEWGILLPDPNRILAGDAKQVRYVPVREIEAIDRLAIAELIATALELPESSNAKKQMIKHWKRGR